MADDNFITRCQNAAKLLDELAKNHARIAEIWAESQHAAFAAACREGARALRAEAESVEGVGKDAKTQAEKDEARRMEREET
jgi:hypothetical protein